ncbi:phage tail tape measure protein [Marinobacter qingdaonensis]|uniref:Phage tail tape measure protein n=1 Tax=Marinobacter qingdaonensis TaxID=3108486 RepID=A0ABU5NUP8_9GAMM|nr:phage tail tape measure protein [Marinobacter sp. ASW11-75]MEA1079530.1 phage tail tape measure protein [Marinobacter sp. ASW11-75]
MAAKSTVEIVFGAIDRTGGTISRLGGQLEDMRGAADSVVSPLANVTDSILKLDAALAAISLAAAAFATKEAVALEASLIDLQKVLGDGQSASDYTDELVALSNEFGVASDVATQSAADFVQSGFTIEEALGLVSDQLIAMNAAELDAAQATSIIIRSLKGFGAEASDAGRLIDILNGVSNKYGVTVAELGEGFAKIAPLANTLGLSFEDVTKYLTPMIEATQSGSESANALKTVLSKLIKPTKDQADLLERELGIQLEVNGQRKSAARILEEVIAKSDRMTEAQKQSTAAILGGAEQASRLAILLNTSSVQADVYSVAMGSAGSAAAEFAVKTESAQFAINRLQTAFKNTGSTIGMEYIEQTKGIADATTGLLQSIQETSQGENADKLFSVLRSALEDLEADITAMAENLPEAFENVDLSGLLDAFGVAGDAIDEIFSIDVTDPAALSEAIQFVVDSLESLTRVSTEIFKELDKMFDLIIAGVDAFNQSGDGAKEMAGQILGMAKTAKIALGAMEGLTGAIDGLGTGLSLLAGASVLKTLGGLTAFNKITPIIAGTTAAVARLATSFTPLGLAVNVAAGAVALATTDFDDLWYSIQKLIGIETEQEKQHKKTMSAIDEMGESIAKLRKQYESGAIDSATYNKGVSEVSGVTRDWASNIKTAVSESEKLRDSSKKTGDAAGKQALEIEKTTKASESAAQAGEMLANSGVSVGTAFEEASEKLGVARNEIEELAFNDRLRLIEVAFDIQSEQARQKLDVMKAELGSVSDFFDSTGETIVQMFDQIGRRDGYDRERLGFLEEEQDRRGKIFRQQQDSLALAKRDLETQGLLTGSVQDLTGLLDLAAQNYGAKVGGSINSAFGATKNLVSETGNLVSRNLEATDSVDGLKLKLDEISAGVFKTAVDLDISRAKTALSSLENAGETALGTISSTGSLITKLVDKISDKSTGYFDRNKFSEILDQEVQMRQESIDTAKRVAEAQVSQAESMTRLNNARAEAFSDGRAQIEIKADGLAPELSLVLEKIVEMSHIEALAGGREYLLGEI